MRTSEPRNQMLDAAAEQKRQVEKQDMANAPSPVRCELIDEKRDEEEASPKYRKAPSALEVDGRHRSVRVGERLVDEHSLLDRVRGAATRGGARALGA